MAGRIRAGIPPDLGRLEDHGFYAGRGVAAKKRNQRTVGHDSGGVEVEDKELTTPAKKPGQAKDTESTKEENNL